MTKEEKDIWDDYQEDNIENAPCSSCPDCGLDFDDADFDFQICSRCGWDADDTNLTTPQEGEEK